MRIPAAAAALLLAALPVSASQLQLVDPNAAADGSATPTQGVVSTELPQMSADGRYIVYTSQAQTLVPGQIDNSLTTDVFLFDRGTGATTLLSHNFASPVTAGDRRSFAPVITRDGRWIAWLSFASDLTPDGVPYPGLEGIYLYDRLAGTTRVAVQDCYTCLAFSLSDDGRYLAFITFTDTPNGAHVVFYDLAMDAYTVVNHAAGPPLRLASGVATGAVVSGDGNSIVYYSTATDLVTDQVDTNGGYDVFLWDRTTGTNTLVSHAAASPSKAGDAVAHPWPLQISFDGRWVAYASAASDLTANILDGNNVDDIFLWDRTTGSNTLVSHTPSVNQAGHGLSAFPHLTPDGRWLAFSSTAPSLAAGVTDTNNDYDAFLYDRATDTVTLLGSKSGAPDRTPSGFTGVWALSDDATAFSLESTATDIAPGIIDTNGGYDFFLYDRGTGKIELATHTTASPNTAANAPTENVTTLSADGRVLLFESFTSNIVAADLNNANDAFAYVRDFQDYFTLTPCRLFDSRQSGPALASGASRKVTARGACGIPATAQALTVNVTVTGPTGGGYVTAYAGAAVLPLASTLNFSTGDTRSNNGVVLLNADGTLALYSSVTGTGTVHAIVDVTGYYQ